MHATDCDSFIHGFMVFTGPHFWTVQYSKVPFRPNQYMYICRMWSPWTLTLFTNVPSLRNEIVEF